MITHSEWLEKIIAKYSGNLTAADCVALNEHILSCHECARAMKEYEELAICLRPLKDNTSTAQLPPRMLALKKKIAQTAQKNSQNRLEEEAYKIIKESFETQEHKTSRNILQQTNTLQDELGEIQLVKAMHFEQYHEAQEGINEVAKVLCNELDKSWLNATKNVLGKVSLVLSGLGLSSLVLINLALLPLDVVLVFIFLPLLTTSLPVFCILVFVIHFKSLDADQVRRYSNTYRAYTDLGRKYLKQPALVLGRQCSFPNKGLDKVDGIERKPLVKH